MTSILMTNSLGNYHVPPNHVPKPFLVLIWIPPRCTPTCKYLRSPKVGFPIWYMSSGSVLLFPFTKMFSNNSLERKTSRKWLLQNDKSEPQAFPWLEIYRQTFPSKGQLNKETLVSWFNPFQLLWVFINILT